MIGSTDAHVIAGALVTAFVLALSTPTFLTILRRLGLGKNAAYRPLGDLYEDEDGKASDESQRKFTTFVPRVIALVASILGSLTSVLYGVLGTLQNPNGEIIETWLRVACWALIALQTLNLFLERRPTARHESGILSAFSCVAVGATLVLAVVSIRQSHDAVDPQTVASLSIQGGLVALIFVSCLSIERRPVVFVNGRVVDEEFTASVWRKFTFQWTWPTLNYAKKNKGLKLENVPLLPDHVRALTLLRAFHESYKFKYLWMRVLWYFRGGLLLTTFLISFAAVLQFGPQLAMLNILTLLEQKEPGDQLNTQAYFWVIGLGVSMTMSTFVETFMFWSTEARLGVPLRGLLASLIFEKATCRKNAQGGHKKKTEPGATEGGEGEDVGVNEGAGPEGNTATRNEAAPQPGDTVVAKGDTEKEKKEEEDEDTEAKKTRQGVINLIAVDTQRFQFFITYFYLYPNVVVKLVISVTFLVNVVGWIPLLAGFAAFLCTVPFNILWSRKYVGASNNLMKFRDQKLASVTEALQGIKQIKYSAIEQQWQERIAEKRGRELKTQRAAFFYDIGLTACWISGPVLLSAVSLTVYTKLHGALSASVAFTTIAVLSQIEVTLAILPELVTDTIDAFVSCERIEKFLNSPDQEEYRKEGPEIVFTGAEITWPSDNPEESAESFRLKNLNLRFPKRELSVIHGKTGSGKTLLLNALIGEVDLIKGTVEMPRAPPLESRFDHQANKGSWLIEDAVSYVPQIPWIENASIKDNILFGLPYDAARYNKTMKVCALEKDLEILDDGDLTEVGSTGIGLSGGQRWRVSFARALYSRSGILILDDIFSAVDAHVGRQLYEEALTGELGVGRTRILVTHHIGLVLSRTKYMVVLGDGVAAHAGSVDELKEAGSLDDILKNEEQEKTVTDKTLHVEEANGNGALTKVLSRSNEAKIDDGEIDTKSKGKPRKLVDDEKREIGAIKARVYGAYLKHSGGWLYWTPAVITYLLNLALSLGKPYWLSIWTRSYATESVNLNSAIHDQHFLTFQNPLTQNNTSSFGLQTLGYKVQDSTDDKTTYFLSIYLGLSFASILIGTFKYLFTYLASLRASRILFEKLSYNVLRAPLRWLDTTPTGRILNRFTADFNTIDSQIAPQTSFFFYQALELLGITAVGCVFVSVYIIPLAIALLGVVVYVAVLYLAGAREIKRLESIAKSPVFEQFGSFLLGITSIRAYAKVPQYMDRMFTKINTHLGAYYTLWLFNRWMGFRQSLVGAVFATVVAAVLVSNIEVDAPLAGFTLSFTIQYTRSIIWTIRMYSQLEMNMNAVERVIDYSELETEDQGGFDPPAAWPAEGRLEVSDLEVRYAPDLPSVLKGLTFNVEKGQRIGIVGRTGSGKSTFTLALFRFLQPFRAGTIYVDGIDISKIKLHYLRSRLAIIPQDPVLFSGTVRSNLDDFGEYSDTDLRNALERVHLTSQKSVSGSGTQTPTGTAADSKSGTAAPSPPTDSNTNIFDSLSSKISEGGLNISQGQRQLLCLARAIARRPKIMVLDEATSAVDMATDELIQQSIRSEFAGCTLLVIAHRLSTIADFDKILVMEEGRAVEFGSPAELMGLEGKDGPKGVFRGMVESSGERERLEGIIREGAR